jgi:predicted TIM-barrel fold metal-dependent hydrolase
MYKQAMSGLTVALVTVAFLGARRGVAKDDIVFNDAHFHLTNYAQEGTDIHDYLKFMDEANIGYSVIFGLPLQQMWRYGNTGEFAPYYYLQTDAPLYYYSFTDAWIAMAYKSLSEKEQKRIYPMITGFNPADMYAADHIRRVMRTFPGVFVGIGEFTIHKEFVSSKIAGPVASLNDPALDRIFDFAGKAGLVTLLHNDINMPFPKPGQEPYMLKQLKALFERHPDTTVIWAHIGLGRIVRPMKEQALIVEKICTTPSLSNVYLDISWDEVAKYATETPETIKRTAAMLNKYPDRFLFGSDCVAPTSSENQMKVYRMWEPVMKLLTPEAKEKIFKTNFHTIYDTARKKVGAWEKAHMDDPLPKPKWSPAAGIPSDYNEVK